MNESSNSKAASGKTHETYPARFDEFGGNTKVPEAVRALAENNIAQAKQMYERSKDAFEAVLANWERSFDAAGQGTAAINRKVIEITQRNINSGFEHAKSLAVAKNLGEVMELQTAYWRKQLSMPGAQAEEMRDLSTQVTTMLRPPSKRSLSAAWMSFRRRRKEPLRHRSTLLSRGVAFKSDRSAASESRDCPPEQCRADSYSVVFPSKCSFSASASELGSL